MENYYFTFCRKCKRHILMLRNVSSGRWIPCDPVIVRFIPDQNGNDWFINEFGENERGLFGNGIGRVGYKRHSYCRLRGSL